MSKQIIIEKRSLSIWLQIFLAIIPIAFALVGYGRLQSDVASKASGERVAQVETALKACQDILTELKAFKIKNDTEHLYLVRSIVRVETLLGGTPLPLPPDIELKP